MAGTWLFGAPLIVLYGAIGFAIANCLVQLTNIVLCYVAKTKVPFTILTTVLPAWFTAASVGAVVFLAQRLLPVNNLFVLVAYITAGLALYLGGVSIFDRKALGRARALFREGQ
jgi:O-antigen/teichoic acid export membrane protein